MAAITPTTMSGAGRYKKLQTSATTTLTDWIWVPAWAQYAIVHLDIATAGTNTIVTLKAAPPWTVDDARAITFFTSATVTAATYHMYVVGFATSVADVAATSTMAFAQAVLPPLLGITSTPTGSTYSTAISFGG